MTFGKKGIPPVLAYGLGAVILVTFLFTHHRATRLAREARGLGDRAQALTIQLEKAQAEREGVRAEAARLEARLAEATNALAAIPPKDESMERRHEKLRAEIARLSEETLRQAAQIEGLKTQGQELQQARGRTETTLREVQSALSGASNEVARLRAADADKTAQLAARAQELANVRTELAATAKANQEAVAARTAAEQKVQALQAQSGADQAELARLRQRVAELEAAAKPAPAPAPEAQ